MVVSTQAQRVSIPSLSGQSVRPEASSRPSMVARLSFNPLTVGAVRSAQTQPSISPTSSMSFQSPHCRGSPFGKDSSLDRSSILRSFNPLTVGAVRSAKHSNWIDPDSIAFQSPHCRGSPFGSDNKVVVIVGPTAQFQSPHCRGSPFGGSYWAMCM